MSERAKILAQSALHILRAHRHEGDRYARMQARHLIAVDRSLAEPEPQQPHWPFGALTPSQLRERDELLRKWDAGQLAVYPEAAR